jgi:hypothetical protein
MSAAYPHSPEVLAAPKKSGEFRIQIRGGLVSSYEFRDVGVDSLRSPADEKLGGLTSDMIY